MSLTKFEEQDFKKPIPKEILHRVKENMETYNLDLSDALEDAARELAVKDSLLWRAWYYNDYREFIPCAYIEKFLDFEKYPLAYADSAQTKK